MLRATAVCTFSTSESELPEVLLTSHVLRATTAYNLASVLFDPPEPQNIVKHSVSRLFYLFAHLHLLSTDSFSSLTLPTSAFPSVQSVGSLTSKLPSNSLFVWERCLKASSLQPGRLPGVDVPQPTYCSEGVANFDPS